MDKCQLCLKVSPLRDSHIIPSFVGAWLKKTSVTGYLRQVVKPNLRRQDIIKQKLLCANCENLLSQEENKFAQEIFYPYVNEELDEWGVAQGKLKEIKYSSWLLRFVIGLQWKALVTHSQLEGGKKGTIKFNNLVASTLPIWADFLLGKRVDSGVQRHYILFLQNLISGQGTLPKNMSDNVNFYLLRSVDTTLAVSEKKLFLYTKLGSIVIISGLMPNTLPNMNDALVRLKGKLITAQHLMNSFVNEFVFVTRPNESFDNYKISDRQSKKIMQDLEKKTPMSKHVNSLLAGYSDVLIKKRR